MLLTKISQASCYTLLGTTQAESHHQRNLSIPFCNTHLYRGNHFIFNNSFLHLTIIPYSLSFTFLPVLFTFVPNLFFVSASFNTMKHSPSNHIGKCASFTSRNFQRKRYCSVHMVILPRTNFIFPIHVRVKICDFIRVKVLERTWQPELSFQSLSPQWWIRIKRSIIPTPTQRFITVENVEKAMIEETTELVFALSCWSIFVEVDLSLTDVCHCV
jgi:hypothetical protein